MCMMMIIMADFHYHYDASSQRCKKQLDQVNNANSVIDNFLINL